MLAKGERLVDIYASRGSALITDERVLDWEIRSSNGG
jgi:hypothetical protein